MRHHATPQDRSPHAPPARTASGGVSVRRFCLGGRLCAGRRSCSGGRRTLVASLLFWACGLFVACPGAVHAEDDAAASRAGWVLPAEFERQEAVLITWDAGDEGMQAALVDVVAAASARVRFLVLVPSAAAEVQAARALRLANVPVRNYRFLRVPTDSVWTRDFGPQVVLERRGNSRMIDCDYGHGDRVGDDLVPAAIAPSLGMRTLRPPITADGGNIQTNGRGLALTTTSILDHNVDRSYTPDQVARVFRDYYGINDLVFLEPLAGESTGHVDMFAVFVDADTVVVGQYDPQHDPVNAELLERNVARLRRVRGPHGPLRIVRIPMPPRDERHWRTYTNVLFANGTLLIPQYPGVDQRGYATALATYRRLMPQWSVAGIDCSRLIRWGGAIHCMTMNLARVPTLEGEADRDNPPREISDDDPHGSSERGIDRRREFVPSSPPYRPYRRVPPGFTAEPPRRPEADDDAEGVYRRFDSDRRFGAPQNVEPGSPVEDRDERFRGSGSRRYDMNDQDDTEPDGYQRPGRLRERTRPMFVPDSRRPVGAVRISGEAFPAE